MKKIILALLSVMLLISINLEPSFANKTRHRRAPALPPIVEVKVDISSQSIYVSTNGWPSGYWKVSSAREGYHTPRGTYGVTRTAAVYFSKKYDNAPMPNSVFFYGGYAIHATNHIANLGRPASHGCIRLAPANAAKLYALVKLYGASRSRITIVD